MSGSDRRGQTLVEFALTIPIFLLIVVGLFDVGRGVYAYNTIANAARAAARVAIVDQDPSAVRGEARQAGVALGLQDSDITLTECSEFDCAYSVTITYDYQPATPFIGALFNPTLSSTAEMPVENVNP